jgi:signal transduction histidine kinase
MVVLFVLLSETTTLYALENSRLYGQYRGAQRALERAGMTERLRIARELHDTLLQSFHGVLLRFQTVVELLPGRPSDAKKLLLDTIDQAAQAITEGRDAVQGLRTSVSEMNDLADSIRALGEELVAEAPNNDVAKLRVDAWGASRDLHPTVRDEAFRIAGEALRNAVQHAGAKQIEVEVRCDERQFELRVRDDGKGIDPELLSEGGREGHFGLRGMQERAKVIGGKLTVWSRPDFGTEVELTIPALHAYAESAPRSGLATKLFPQGSTTES